MKKIQITALLCAAVMALSACSVSKRAVQESAEDILANGEIKDEITVAYFMHSYKSFIDEAAGKFKKIYPDTKVNIEFFGQLPGSESTDDDEQAKIDYINRITTELMSGRGADILAIDVLPFYKYSQNQSLVNLRELMNNDPEFKNEDYRMNLLDAVSDENGQFIMPVDYQFRFFIYDGSLFNERQKNELSSFERISLEHLVEYGMEAFTAANQSAKEPVYMFGFHPGILEPSLFEQLYYQNYGLFIDIRSKKVNFNDGLFADMLKLINEYAQTGIIKPGKGDDNIKGGFIDGYTTSETIGRKHNLDLSERFFFKTQSSNSNLYTLGKNTAASSFIIINSATGNIENDEMTGIVANKNGEVSFTCKSFGINSNSVNKRTAWEFIKLLISNEMQESLNLAGIPVNRNAIFDRVKREIRGNFYSKGSSVELGTELQKVFDEYIKQMDKYSDAINTYYIKEVVINNLVNSEVRSFFDGEKTAEEAADILQSKISRYLNE